jgi:hypothetical protein
MELVLVAIANSCPACDESDLWRRTFRWEWVNGQTGLGPAGSLSTTLTIRGATDSSCCAVSAPEGRPTQCWLNRFKILVSTRIRTQRPIRGIPAHLFSVAFQSETVILDPHRYDWRPTMALFFQPYGTAPPGVKGSWGCPGLIVLSPRSVTFMIHDIFATVLRRNPVRGRF